MLRTPLRIKLRLLLALLFLAESALAQEVPDFTQIASFIRWGGVFLSFFVVIGTAVLLRIVTTLGDRLGVRFSGRRMTIQKVESFIRFFVYIAAASIIMGLSVRLDAAAMTVIGASLGFSIGFAMRDLVAAFIAGITIMIDRPFQVGDRVEYAGEYGDIIAIGLRSVRMNTLDHNIVTIPNNKVLTDVTSCANYGALTMQVAMHFYIGVDQNLRLARELVHQACITSRFCHLERPVPVLCAQTILSDYITYDLTARPYVLDVKYEKAFESDVHERVQQAFREHGIRPPAVLHRGLNAAEGMDAPTPRHVAPEVAASSKAGVEEGSNVEPQQGSESGTNTGTTSKG